jgi:chloramphenicol 3-O-phosphotransferase
VPDVLILTGPPGAGKSSVAEALADRYDRVAHIDVDTVRHFITPTGYIHPGHAGFDHQRDIATRNVCAMSRNYLEERFGVIIDDVVIDRAQLGAYVEGLKPAGFAVHYIRLLPSLEACKARNAARREARIAAERLEVVYGEFEQAGDIGGVTIDSSELTVYTTADRVQALTTSGESIVWRPGG